MMKRGGLISRHSRKFVERPGLGNFAAVMLIVGYCMVVHNTSSANRQEWYAGGHLSSASMANWMSARERDRLATAADFATEALQLKYGSRQAAMRTLGAMENLRPYATEVQACITAAVRQPPEMTEELWSEALEQQRVDEIGADCAQEYRQTVGDAQRRGSE